MPNLALAVGISDYGSRAKRLAGVARDVREISKLLGSSKSQFGTGLTVLTDKEATFQALKLELEKLLKRAKRGDTVMLFLAGHGRLSGRGAYFLPHDFVSDRLSTTALALKDLRTLFEACKSQRILFVLDFCHSGGIVSRGSGTVTRELKVLEGSGRVVLAACTEKEVSNETPDIGQGWFTKSILDGLKGKAKNSAGNVTPNSLHDYAVHYVREKGKEWFDTTQTPVFFGEVKGEMVLAVYEPSRRKGATEAPIASPPFAAHRSKAAPTAKPAARPGAGTWVSSSGNWALLDGLMIPVKNVKEADHERVVVTFEYTDPASEAKFRNLQRNQFHARVHFAHRNRGMVAQVQKLEIDLATKGERATLQMVRQQNAVHEFGFNGLTADEVAQIKARKILLNETPSNGSARTFADFLVPKALKCPLATQTGSEKGPRLLYRVRLETILELCTQGIVEHIYELGYRQVGRNEVQVKFRGVRGSGTELEVKGGVRLR